MQMVAPIQVGGRRCELPEISLIDEIDDLAKDYRERSGRAPIYVSHWDPSEAFVKRLHKFIPNPKYDNPVPYTYSYLLKRRPAGLRGVLDKLGFGGAEVGAQIVENGTTAIAGIANWLSVTGIKEIVLLRPYYFVVPHNMRRLGLKVREINLKQTNGTYAFPKDLQLGPGQALWLTHPVYATGIYSMANYVDDLRRIADAGAVVVADEALAIPSSDIAKALGGHPNFIGMYTPHKALCINSLKFSIIVYHPGTGDTFDHWSDVIAGGLSVSAAAAVKHFLDPSFESYSREFSALIERTRTWHSGLVSRFNGAMRTDTNTRGHFVSVYFPRLDARLGNDVPFLSNIMDATGCTFIPGIRNGLDSSLGLSFRINLAQNSREFRIGLKTLYEYLTALSA